MNVYSLKRDSKYYFEDGSITFRVDNFLFKVHASILKLQSEDLESKLDIPPKHIGARCKGCPRMESPVLITGSKPSQFRNLMEIVYCPPPNKLAIIEPVTSNESAWRNFVFYLDVATLSRRLGMVRLEGWAKSELVKLVRAAPRELSEGNLLSVGNYHLVPAEYHPAFRLIQGTQYAQEILDVPLLRGLRSIFYYHCSYLPINALVSLFKTAGLREKDRSLFGFLFLLLLSEGNETWERDIFDQTDRMAFFSAQSHLTPLPNSLATSLRTPLFNRLKSAKGFVNQFRSQFTMPSCAESCYKDAFDLCWRQKFDKKFYSRIHSTKPLVAVAALTDIPLCGLELAKSLSDIKCDHECHMDILGVLDQDIQAVYAQISDYYQHIV